jgi:hypothetical protein
MDYSYDVVYVDDMSATTSPDFATQMVLYNGDADGFIGNSTGHTEGFEILGVRYSV